MNDATRTFVRLLECGWEEITQEHMIREFGHMCYTDIGHRYAKRNGDLMILIPGDHADSGLSTQVHIEGGEWAGFEFRGTGLAI